MYTYYMLVIGTVEFNVTLDTVQVTDEVFGTIGRSGDSSLV